MVFATSVFSSVAAWWLSLTVAGLLGAAAVFIVLTILRKKQDRRNCCRRPERRPLEFDLFSALGDIVVAADAAGKIVFMNPSAEKFLGVKSDNLQGRHYRELFCLTECDADAASFDPFAEVLKTGKQVVADRMIRIMTPDGRPCKVSDRVVTIPLSDEMAPYMVMIVHDIGELGERQLKLQAELDNANSLNSRMNEAIAAYEMLIDIMPVYFYMKDADNGFKYLKCNRICGDLWGITLAEAVGRLDEELFGNTDTVHMIRETDMLVMQSAGVREDVLPFIGKDGKRRIGRFYRRGVTMPGNRHRLLGLVVDITEEQNQRSLLSAALNAFEYAFDLTQTAIFRLDVKTGEMNGAKNLNTLWPIQNGIGKNWAEVVYSEDIEKFAGEWEKLLSGQIEKMIVDYRSTCFGELKYYRLEAGLDHQINGKTSVVGIIQDVTLEKKREQDFISEQLRQNSILNAILSAIPSQVFIKDVNDNLRYKLANRNFTDYYRLAEEDVVGHVDSEIFPKAVAEQLREHDTMVCASVGKVFRFDEDISYMQAGKEIFKSLKVCFETADHNKYLLGVCVDVTELETAKKEAEETAERLRLTLNSIGDGVFAIDLEGRISMMNPVAERMTGVSFEQAKGKPHEQVFRILSALDDSPVPSPVADAIRTGKVIELANHTDLLSASGQRYHIADSAAPIFNADNAIIGAILVFRDITEEYRQRGMLRATMAQLELGAEMTRSGTFRLNLDSQRISGSKLLPTLWPVTDGVAEKAENWVFHEDVAGFEQLIESLVYGGPDIKNYVYRAGRGGVLRQYQISMILDNGNAGCRDIVGVIQDVTEIRENAAKLKATQELWELIINSIPTMFFVKDAEDGFRYKLCNQAFAAFIGRTPAEIIGRTDAELFNPDDFEQYVQKDHQIMQSGAAERFDEIFTDHRGLQHFIRAFKRPIVGVDNRNMLLGVCMDITEMHNLLQYEHINNAVLTYAVSEPKFAPLVEKILQTMLDSLKCDRVLFASLDKDGQLHRYRGVYSQRNLPFAAIGLNYHEELWNQYLSRFKAHEFISYEKFSDIPGSGKLLERVPAYANSSAAGLPVFVGEEFIGVLIVSFLEKHVFENIDNRMMRAMASMIALARIREKQRQAVRHAEAMNQTILDNLNIPIWLYDLNGVVVQNNRAAEDLLDGAEIKHAPYDCRNVLECKKNDEECPIRQCVLSHQGKQCSYRGINRREFVADIRPIFDDDGKMVNVVKSFFDITSLRRMIGNQQLLNDCLASLLREKDIMQALNFSLRSICEHTGVDRCFIMQFQPTSKTFSSFIEVSRSGEPSLSGSGTDALCSTGPNWASRFRVEPVLSIPDLRASIESDELLSSWKPMIERCDCRSFYGHRINSGEELWGYVGMFYEKEMKVLTAEELDFFGAVASCVELMLDRQKNQQEVLIALEKAKAADRAKSLFLASMSHEIRTPLNAVIGFSELLRDGTLPPAEQKEYLTNISTAGNSLLSLINDVLDLSKLEAGQMVLMPEAVDFSALANEVGGIFSQKCAERGLVLTLDISEEMPLVWIDKLRIRQVLFNLLGNAVKFTDQGGISVKADFVRKSESCGDFSFHVIDTGCGIAPEDQKKLFQFFVQSSALRGTQVTKNGTGLGLAICKRLVEQMNGVLELHSEPGRGSDFSVLLHDVRFGTAKKPTAAVKEKKEVLHCASGLTALLVDDVRMNLQVMSAMLKKLGVESVQASDGAEALQRLEGGGIDFVLTDMWMPGLNGAELATKIRKNKKMAKIPVFAVTADIEANENFSLDAFAGVLLKPVTGEKLRKLVAKVASQRS